MFKKNYLRLYVCLIFLFIANFLNASQWPPKVWTEKIVPFKIIDPVYYVGSRELSSYLVVDENGLILINVGMEANAKQVINNIETLGFDSKDIKYILITQAHFDHAGGAEYVRKLTNAEVLAGTADVPLLLSGGLNDYAFADKLTFEPVLKANATEDEQYINLGEIKLKTISTPGHTAGSSSWFLTLNDEAKTTVLLQSRISVLGSAKLVDNHIYPHIINDYHKTFKRLNALEVDYVLPDHLQFVHPEGFDHKSTFKSIWFKQKNVLSRQINKSRQKLNKKLTQNKPVEE